MGLQALLLFLPTIPLIDGDLRGHYRADGTPLTVLPVNLAVESQVASSSVPWQGGTIPREGWEALTCIRLDEAPRHALRRIR